MQDSIFARDRSIFRRLIFARVEQAVLIKGLIAMKLIEGHRGGLWTGLKSLIPLPHLLIRT